MTVDPAYRMLPPVDTEAHQRAERLRDLGLREQPDPDFDEFARQLASTMQGTYAMVNIIGPRRQYFAGLYPSSADRGVDWQVDPVRAMACDHGYCMHVVVRGHAMSLPDVLDYARHAVNPVVEENGIRAYLGAPLVDVDGMILGTICVLDTKPRPEWGSEAVEWIKGRAAELTAWVLQRAGSSRASGT
ncbi:MAG TPA: GAF domain-containing protein [Trebonia sp.]|jgi:GAF domain-containing protein|nr:GAF domain-containing protein [Trebonia sp.]